MKMRWPVARVEGGIILARILSHMRLECINHSAVDIEDREEALYGEMGRGIVDEWECPQPLLVQIGIILKR